MKSATVPDEPANAIHYIWHDIHRYSYKQGTILFFYCILNGRCPYFKALKACIEAVDRYVYTSIHSRFRRFHFFLKLLEPPWMGEIVGSDNGDAFQFRPVLELFGHVALALHNEKTSVYTKVADPERLFLLANLFLKLHLRNYYEDILQIRI
ncbi:MAG: hypothetical protein JW976_11320 [Syntrophaceae bacterium]|nr:hypothetical protein [Syntrophaceae bacterium]